MKKIKSIFAMLLVAGLMGACGPLVDDNPTSGPVKVSEIQIADITDGAVTLTIGSSFTVTVVISPANAADQSLSFITTDETVATVDAEGLVQAVGKGTATITVVSNDDPTISESFTVTVADDIMKISDAIDQGQAEARRR
jgi:uncharacterized protein YjdB